MAVMGYLIGTNPLIYYFNGLTDDEKLHDILTKSYHISIITKIEFLGWGKFFNNPDLHAQARAFTRHAIIFDLNEKIVNQAIALRQQFKSKTPDAIIASTALVNNLMVVTNNTKDIARLGVRTISVTVKPSMLPASE